MNIFKLPLIVGTLPVTLANGTTADATQVMSDLNWIVNQVNANAAPLASVALLAAANTFTAVQSGVAATLPANFPIASQVQNFAFNTLSSTLGTNTITARIAGMSLTAFARGQVFEFFPSQPNTGAVNITIDGIGPRNVFSMGSALAGGEFTVGVPVQALDDGTQLNIVSQRKIGTVLANSLSSGVALATVGSYFTGPRVAQGSIGVWLATAQVLVQDTAGAANIFAQLTDGTNIQASGIAFIPAANVVDLVPLSGVFSFPSGDIRILVRDVTSGSGRIVPNDSGLGKDSTLTVVRIG